MLYEKKKNLLKKVRFNHYGLYSGIVKKDYKWGGKIEVTCRGLIKNRNGLSLAYTPEVVQLFENNEGCS